MSRDSIYAAQLRDKFAREALMDLPRNAAPEVRQAAQHRAELARQEHARVAAACHRENVSKGRV